MKPDDDAMILPKDEARMIRELEEIEPGLSDMLPAEIRDLLKRRLQRLTWGELLARMDPSTHERLRLIRTLPGTDGLVLLRCEVLDSSRCGQITAMAYGPGRTATCLEDFDGPGGVYVTGLPSSASFPIAYTEDMPCAK